MWGVNNGGDDGDWALRSATFKGINCNYLYHPNLNMNMSIHNQE